MDDSWWYMMINHQKHVMSDEWWETMINDKLWQMMTNYKFMINDDNWWTITIYGCQQPVCYGMGLFCYIHGSNIAANPQTSSNIQLSICFLVGSWTHGVYGWTPQLGMSGACTVHGSGSAARGSMSGRVYTLQRGVKEFAPSQLPWYATSQPRAQTSDVSSNG